MTYFSNKNRFFITDEYWIVDADGTTVANQPAPLTKPDVANFAIVPDQVTDASTFVVEVVADMVNPISPMITPIITRGDGTTYTPTAVMLQYPGTSDDSTEVWRATVDLELGENTFTIESAAEGTQTISLWRKTALETITVTNQTDLRNEVVTMLRQGSTTDELIIDFDGADMHAAMASVANSGSQYNYGDRLTWATIKPAPGRVVQWDTEDTSEYDIRPNATFICCEGWTIGSSTQTQRGAQLYFPAGHKAWIKDCTWTAKYDFSYTSADAGKPSDNLPGPGTGDMAVADFDGRSWYRNTGVEMYMTGCNLTGIISPQGGHYMCRDQVYTECRHDTASNNKITLNLKVNSVLGLVNASRTDYFHVDLFQRWGNALNGINQYHNNQYWAGLKLYNNGPLESETQILLFDRSVQNSWTYMIWKDIDTTDMDTSFANHFVQFAGWVTNMKVANIKTAPAAYFTFRADFVSPADYQWTPNDVYLTDIEIGKVTYNKVGETSVVVDTPEAEATDTLNTANTFFASGMDWVSPNEIL